LATQHLFYEYPCDTIHQQQPLEGIYVTMELPWALLIMKKGQKFWSIS
jgi:hypothetical protein